MYRIASQRPLHNGGFNVQGNKLIQSYSVTDAAVHGSQVFDELLDQTVDANGNKRPVYAGSAYRSEAQEQRLSTAGIDSQICEKGIRGNPLTDTQKQSNRIKSKVRARVEHVFGAQAAMGGTPCAHPRHSAGKGENRADEFGLQQGAITAIA